MALHDTDDASLLPTILFINRNFSSVTVHATIIMESGVSAEVIFAQKLASNEKKIRDKAVKRLSKYLSARSKHEAGLSESDLLKIWKGLFYCMWMQDKPLIQEELSERITSLVHYFSKTEDALKFVKVFLETQSREWNGIDKLRLDKFLMMVRDMLHQTFILLSKDDWQEDHCRMFALAVYEQVMNAHEPRLPDGLKLHLADIFVEELKKVSVEKLTNKTMLILLQPFIEFILFTNKIELARRVIGVVIYKIVKAISASSKVSTAKDDDTTDETSQVDEEMEIDVPSQQKWNHKCFHLNKGVLLKPIFEMAGRTPIRASNRALIYKLVKKHAKALKSITNSLTSSDQSSDVSDLRFLKDDGKAVDQQQGQKRKKKGKNSEKHSEQSDTTDVHVSVETIIDSNDVNQPKRLTKKKKTKPGNDENASTPQQIVAKKCKLKNKNQESVFSPERKSDLVAVKHIDQYTDSNTNNVDSLTPVLGDIKGLGNMPTSKNNTTKQDISNCNNDTDTVSRKRKFVSEDSNSSPSKKKSKLNSTDSGKESINSPQDEVDKSPKRKNVSSVTRTLLNKLNAEATLPIIINSCQSEGDTNSNAKPKYRSSSPPKTCPSPAPVELVKYSNKYKASSPANKTFAKNELDVSPHLSKKSPMSGMASVLGRKIRSKSESPKKKSPSTSKLAEEIAMSVPLNMAMKASCSSGTDEKSETPGSAFSSKKKVIFDLRRNKANKFQDYLKSLAKQPDSPFEPTKSPAVGILKSPGNSPALSPVPSEIITDSDSECRTPPHSGSKKRPGYGRRRSAPGSLVHRPGGKKTKTLFKVYQ